MPETHLVEKRHPMAIPFLLKNYGAILKNKVFIFNLSSFCLFFSGLIGILSALPFLAITTFHYSPIQYGVSQGFIFGGFILGSLSVKKYLDKLGAQKLISTGLSISFSGALLSAMLFHHLTQVYNFIAFIAGLTIFAAGGAMASSSLQRSAINAATEPMGARMAIFSSFISWSGVIASLSISSFINIIVHHALNQNGPLMLSGFLMLAIGSAIILQWRLRYLKE